MFQKHVVNDEFPLQTFIRQFNSMEFANDYLKEKQGVIVRREPFSLTNSGPPSGAFYLYRNCEHLTDGYKQVILDDECEVVCVGIKDVPLLTKDNQDELDWVTAYAEDYVEGTIIMVYDYKGVPFIATEDSPKANNFIPGRHVSYRAQFTKCMLDRHKTLGVNNALYVFKPMYHYYLIYNPDYKRGLKYQDEITLITATHADTLQPVSDTRLTTLADELKVDIADYSSVVNYVDSLNYFNTIKHDVDKVFITDGKKKFKLSI